MKKALKFIVTGLNSGYIPGAPGTYGTIVGVLLYLAIYQLPFISYILFCIAFVFFSVWSIGQVLSDFDSDDPSAVVIDEMAGFFIAMIGHPFSWLTLGMGFVLFRFFDIVKPFPIRLIDRKVKGPWGIVLDDVLAGVFACIVIWLVRIFILKG